MKKILDILKNPMLISVIGLLALAIIIWFGGPLLAIGESKPLETETNRLVGILILAVLWGLNNFRVHNKEKQKDANMLAELTRESPADVKDEKHAEDLKAIQQHFSEASRIIKASKKQKGGTAIPIHELPWYVIIGPPGSGKTTALVNSGLRFPLADKMGNQPLKGVGGTRNCDWWFSDDAILIDTAGRYTTQDSHQGSDSKAWDGFLKLLKKHRPRQPINGAIIAISLSELLTQSETERQEHAQNIKNRLQELYKTLGIQFPVYVILTKIDLIAGFNEFFDNLSRNEREQILGMTFPADQNLTSRYEIDFFKEQFNAILKNLNNRLQWRLHDERDLTRRSLILNFPTEFTSTRDMISQFLGNTFLPSNFDQPVNLRGVYFTSGTQEGTPIDRVMGTLASNFGLNRQTVPSYSGQGKSYFLTQLFQHVIFPESRIAGTNRLYESKQLWTKRGAYAASIVLTAVTIGVWTTEYGTIKNQIDKLSAQIDTFNNAAENLPAVVKDPTELLPALEILHHASTEVSKQNRSMFSQAGLSQMSSLGPATDDAYQRALITLFYPAVVSLLEQQMENRDAPLETLFVQLKTYLMLADEQRFEKKEVQSWFYSHWQQQFAGNQDKQATLKSHLDALFKLERADIGLNNTLVADVRERLQKIPLSQRIYGALKQKASATIQDFFLTDTLETREQAVFLNKTNEDLPIRGVPGLYTKEGYESFFREESVRLAKASTEDDWVFGSIKENQKNAIDPDTIHAEINDYYQKDFIKHWEALYDSIKVAKFKSFEQGVEYLELIGGDKTAITRIIDAVNINTDLRSKPNLLQEVGADNLKKAGKFGKKAAKKVKSDIPLTPTGEALRKHFKNMIELTDTSGNKPPLFDKHLVSLAKLQAYLNEIVVSPDPGATSLELAINRMSSNGNDIIGKLRRDSRRLPSPIDNWLKTLSSNSWQIILANSKTHINELWKNDVITRYERSIQNRYPVYKSSSQNTSLEDFTDFFGPEGHYTRFLESNLFPFIDTKSSRWKLKVLEGQSLSMSSTTLRQLKDGHEIKQAFFGRNEDTIKVNFQMKPEKLDAKARRVTLQFDDEKLVYRHGPQRSSSLTWPFTDTPDNSKVSILFNTDSSKTGVRKSGTWAFFRLLNEANIREAGAADKFTVNFTVDGINAKYLLKANSVNNPFNMKTIHSFRAPKSL